MKIKIHERNNIISAIQVGPQTWSSVDNGTMTWDEAVAFAENISGWRLPTKEDFKDLIKSKGGERLAGDNIGWNSSIQPKYYWSSTSYTDNSAYAMVLRSSSTSIRAYPKSSKYFVRLIKE